MIPRNGLLLGLSFLGWLLSFPLAVFLTAAAVLDLNRLRNGFPLSTSDILYSLIVLVLTWIVAMWFSYVLLRFSWRETIQVSLQSIDLHYDGFLAFRTKTIPRAEIWRVSYEKIHTRTLREASFSLNIFYGDRRESLAFWMRESEKIALFHLLSQQIQSRRWPNIDFRLQEEVKK